MTATVRASEHTEPIPPKWPPPRRVPRDDPGLPEGDGLPDDPEDWPDREEGPIQ
jgi:hypothetical protein